MTIEEQYKRFKELSKIKWSDVDFEMNTPVKPIEFQTEIYDPVYTIDKDIIIWTCPFSGNWVRNGKTEYIEKGEQRTIKLK